jgi:hypothetical protein
MAMFLVTPSIAMAEPVDFVRDVRPILAEACFKCHGPDKQESGLRLDEPVLLLSMAIVALPWSRARATAC